MKPTVDGQKRPRDEPLGTLQFKDLFRQPVEGLAVIELAPDKGWNMFNGFTDSAWQDTEKLGLSDLPASAPSNA